jgi:hypothetical protein
MISAKFYGIKITVRLVPEYSALSKIDVERDWVFYKIARCVIISYNNHPGRNYENKQKNGGQGDHHSKYIYNLRVSIGDFQNYAL